MPALVRVAQTLAEGPITGGHHGEARQRGSSGQARQGVSIGANCHRSKRYISATMGQCRLRGTLGKKEGAGIAQARTFPQRRCHSMNPACQQPGKSNGVGKREGLSLLRPTVFQALLQAPSKYYRIDASDSPMTRIPLSSHS